MGKSFTCSSFIRITVVLNSRKLLHSAWKWNIIIVPEDDVGVGVVHIHLFDHKREKLRWHLCHGTRLCIMNNNQSVSTERQLSLRKQWCFQKLIRIFCTNSERCGRYTWMFHHFLRGIYWNIHFSENTNGHCKMLHITDYFCRFNYKIYELNFESLE